MKLAIGATLQNGKYAITNILGQDDLSISLQATQAFLNQPVVLKTLSPNAQVPVEFVQLRQQFSQEARRFARCQHPGLVRLLDIFEEEGLPFAVMDFISGQSLTERVQSYGALPETQALQYIRQVGSALTVLHRQGLTHRSVQPANLLRPTGTDFVVLVDYEILDLSVFSQPTATTHQENDPYRAIECYQPTAHLTPATDVYALAATLYFLLTGQPPTPATQQEQSPLAAPRKLQPGITPETEAAILRGMAAKAEARPQTIAAWFAQLPGTNLQPPVQPSPGALLPDLQPTAAINSPNPPAATNGKPQPAISPPVSHAATVAAQQALPVAPLPPRKSRLPKVLVGTATIAALAGIGLGLGLRLGAATGIGPKIFHTQQTFPPLPDWEGAAEPVAAPIEPSRLTPERSQLAPPAPARPRPTPQPTTTPLAQPSPEPTIEAIPTPDSSQNSPPESSITPAPVAPVVTPEPELPPPVPTDIPGSKSGGLPPKTMDEKEPLRQ